MFGRLQVDNNQFATLALGEEWEVSTGFDLQGRAQSQSQVRSSKEDDATHKPVLHHSYIIDAICISNRLSYSVKLHYSFI